jgi:hypothetical protein
MYDLRIGESSMNYIANNLDEQIDIEHALRADIEDYRQKLIESDQILNQYEACLNKQVLKNKELQNKIKHLNLIQDYGYDDDDRSIAQYKSKIDDYKMLLQEKNLMLDAQKDINKKLMEQLQLIKPADTTV